MEDKLLEQGIAVVALFGVSYYVIRLTNFLFRTLAGGLDEHKEITIKQIDALNQIRSTLCDLKQEMVKLHEQNRIYRDIDNTVFQRLQNADRPKRS